MSTYFDKAINNLDSEREEMINFQAQPLSETDSRSKIIDPLLIKVFQWEEKLVLREPHIAAGFIDYYCSSDKNRFVVEAKSTKIDFKVPYNKKVHYTSISTIKKTNSLLYDAIEQAKRYGQEKNTPFFVVSNGLCLILGKTYLSGDEEYNLMIYNGFDAIKENISVLLSILSPYEAGADYFFECIESGKELRSKPQFNKTILQNAFYNSHNAGSSNTLAKPLMDILKTYFDDISKEYELLDNLYCNTKNLDSYSKEMRSFLKGRVPMLGLPIEQTPQIETSDESSTILGRDMQMKRQNKRDGHLFILFGNLGAGKTTFLNRYHEFILTSIQKRKLLWVYVDFQSFYGNKDDIDKFIVDKIQEEIYAAKREAMSFDNLKKIYEEEISRKIEGVWAPFTNDQHELNKKISDFIGTMMMSSKNHIDRCLKYLKEKYGFEICLVFDNIDQHPDSLQEKVSLYAVTSTKELGALAIVSMRDETYWSLRKRPPLNAYGNITSYQVVSPSMEQVLLTRLDYVLSILGEKSITFDVNNRNGSSYGVKMNYKSVFSLFRETIQTEVAKDLLNKLSSGDIRTGLDIFRKLITSSQIDLVNILAFPLQESGNGKILAKDKIIKAIGLADLDYYDSEKSFFINLFKSNSFDGFYSHFINYRILEILEDNISSKPVIDGPEGFMEIGILFDKLNIYCVNEDNMRELLVPFLERFLIESDIGARRYDDEYYYNNIKFVRITPAGLYCKNTLMFDYQYLEMVMIDTPIHDRDVYENLLQEIRRIKVSSYLTSWKHKFNAVSTFLNYLKIKEEEEMCWVKKHNIKHFGLIMPEVIAEYEHTKDEIQRKIDQKERPKSF